MKESIRRTRGEYSEEALDLMRKLETAVRDVPLRQNTEDEEQLDPIRRIASIERVWNVAAPHLGSTRRIIDAGSGFGYGAVYLGTRKKHVVGIEKASSKIDQAFRLYAKAGIPLITEEQVQFGPTPSIVRGDFNKMKLPEADVVTMFYVSGEMLKKPHTIETARRILGTKGTLLISTELPEEKVHQWLSVHPIEDATVQILPVPKNYEQTVVLIKFT